jgi:predicted aconitate hydratase
MSKNLTEKIIDAHLVDGKLEAGEEVGIRIDQTLTQDVTGTMAWLQFEAMGIERVRTKRSVSYIDHNTLQTGPESANDHMYLQSAAAKFGAYFSRPGNGICHQVHLERFAACGQTLLGSDSHTPTAGGLGMIAIGAGGVDVAAAMAGGAFYLTMPSVINVRLKGKLGPWVSAKDVILKLLEILSVKGGVGKVIEYSGPGLKNLSVSDRATITNMGAELGATTSVFPTDEITRKFLDSQARPGVWKKLAADPGANYERVIDIDLSQLVPMIAKPHSPDNVTTVKSLKGLKVDQVCIGSCTNSSLKDLMTVAEMLKGKKIADNISLVISPGSRQVLEMISRNGAVAELIAAGARIVESACGPCIGMGHAPTNKAVSIRTFNRNFKGRSGTPDAGIYLASPEVAAATALKGKLTDPRELGAPPKIKLPQKMLIDDSMVLAPKRKSAKVEIVRGPNLAPCPINKKLGATLQAKVLLKTGDNITTDDIMPAGAKILPLRSNIPAISEYVFSQMDPAFAQRAKKAKRGAIIGGENYGQGSSREHAALAPMYLGIKAVIAKSFARIHKANLINFGILPLTFANKRDYAAIRPGDKIKITGISKKLSSGSTSFKVQNLTRKKEFQVEIELTDRQRSILLAGGLLPFIALNAE